MHLTFWRLVTLIVNLYSCVFEVQLFLVLLLYMSLIAIFFCQSNGRKFEITSDKFWKDGRPFQIIGGDVHYFRVVPEVIFLLSTCSSSYSCNYIAMVFCDNCYI